jgi:hypothetical protein
LEIKDKEKYEDKIVKLVNAQEYLKEYLVVNLKQKSEIIGTLRIDAKNLEGELEMEGFSNLERLDCDTNKLTKLKIIDCPKLKKIYCSTNQLRDLVLEGLSQLEILSCSNNYLSDTNFLNGLENPERLISLNIQNNNFEEQGLEVFGQFTSLKTLSIGNEDKEKIEKGIYNQFCDSLEPLKDLNELNSLHISNTNINYGLEYLPESTRTLECEVISNEFNFQVSKIKDQLTLCDNDIKI